MRRCFGHARCSLSALRTWIMRESVCVVGGRVDLLGRLSIAFSHCMCTGRWGAIWFRLIFPASSWIPSNCCLDPFVVAMGLPSGSDIYCAYLFWWVSKCDRAFGPDQAAGERSLYIPRQASATGNIFIHQFFIIFSTGTFHRRYLSIRESLTCRPGPRAFYRYS
jgi:hypothetical protein